MCTKSNSILIPVQEKFIPSVQNIPVEYFEWGTFPDHFKIDMPHRHDFVELLFIEKGGGTHEIDFQNYDLSDYSIYYVPQSKVHFLNRGVHSKGFTLAFHMHQLERDVDHRIVSPFSTVPFVLNLDLQTFKDVADISAVIKRQIQKRHQMTSKCFLLSIELLFHSIAIIKNQSDLSEVVETKDRLVRHFETLIHAHAYKNNPVNWYAEQLNLSPRYLSNHCRQMAGIGPKKYITKHYLKLIKQWLLRSDKSVKQIAFENNISEAALCKLFKREVGITMTDYRSG